VHGVENRLRYLDIRDNVCHRVAVELARSDIICPVF